MRLSRRETLPLVGVVPLSSSAAAASTALVRKRAQALSHLLVALFDSTLESLASFNTWMHAAVGWKRAQVLDKLQVALISSCFESVVVHSAGIHTTFEGKGA